MNWTCRFCNKRTSHPAPWKGCPNLITLFVFRFSLFGKVEAGMPSQKGKSDKIKRTCRLYEVTQAVVPNLDWGQEILHRIHRNSGNARTNLANPADLQDSRFAHSRLQCAHPPDLAQDRRSYNQLVERLILKASNSFFVPLFSILFPRSHRRYGLTNERPNPSRSNCHVSFPGKTCSLAGSVISFNGSFSLVIHAFLRFRDERAFMSARKL